MAANFSLWKRWVKPEIYPLFVPIAFAIGLCGFSLTRKVVADPGITISKEARSHGLSDDHDAGKAYKMNYLRKFVDGRPPEITPSLNRYLSGKE